MMKWPSGVLVNMHTECCSSALSAVGKYLATGARSAATSASVSSLLTSSGRTCCLRWWYTPILKPAGAGQTRGCVSCKCKQ